MSYGLAAASANVGVAAPCPCDEGRWVCPLRERQLAPRPTRNALPDLAVLSRGQLSRSSGIAAVARYPATSRLGHQFAKRFSSVLRMTDGSTSTPVQYLIPITP